MSHVTQIDHSPVPEEPHRPVQFSTPDVRPDDVEAVTRVLRSGWITTGTECDAFEAELADRLGAHAVIMSSCTAALETAVAHLGLAPGTMVGVPTWTFVSTALVVERQGLVPVLLDVDPSTLNLSPEALEAALALGLGAVIAVHMGGVPVAPAVFELCAAASVPVIEDAAHALGTRDRRGQVGATNPAGACFSFYATKNLTTAEGGALVTPDKELAEFARSYRIHGLSLDAYMRYQPGPIKEYDLVTGGIKANMPDVLAALGRSQLARFDATQLIRRQLIDAYRRRLAAIPGVGVIPEETVDGSADHLMIVLLPDGVDRDLVRSELAADGIGTSVHFRPLHTFDWLDQRSIRGPAGVRTADRLRCRALSLPLHPLLDDEDVAYVCQRLELHVGRP